MAFPEINTIEDLIAAIDGYFTSPRRPPLKGEEANFVLKKLLALTMSYTDKSISDLKGDVPELFDTLEEIANQIELFEQQLSYDEQPMQTSSKLVNSGGIWAYVESKISDVVKYLVTHPTYQAPSAALSSPQSSGIYEVGQSINVSLVLAYTQRDGGSVAAFSIRKANTPISSANAFTDNNVVLSTTPTAYQGTVSYNAGPLKYDTLPDGSQGDAYPSGQILAGSVNSNVMNFTGYYACWFGFGASDAIPATSAEIRGLQTYNAANALISGKQLMNTASVTVTHRTGIVRKTHVIVTPPNKSIISVIDLDFLNSEIKDDYILQGNISVNDASGNAIQGCKLYIKSMDVSYEGSHRHQITIS
jgi:hypothetical protein